MKYPWHCIPRIVQILDWLHDDHEIVLKAEDPKQPHTLNTLIVYSIFRGRDLSKS
jgi:hypothetical protein